MSSGSQFYKKERQGGFRLQQNPADVYTYLGYNDKINKVGENIPDVRTDQNVPQQSLKKYLLKGTFWFVGQLKRRVQISSSA